MKTNSVIGIMQLVSKIGLLSIVSIVACPVDALADESRYLYVWAADADHRDSDFLAVIDADPESSAYGAVLTTLQVGMPTHAHHTEHRMPEDSLLFINGWLAGQTYVIDLNEPLVPRISATFMDRGPFSFPHSFERLPNGNVLSSFQTGPVNRRPLGDIAGVDFLEAKRFYLEARGESVSTGGLVELTPAGEFVRGSSAANPEFPGIRPYSLAIISAADRVVTTTSDMSRQQANDTIQIWRLSDLALLHTVPLPPGPRGDENMNPAEPRLMADGKTVLVNTFSCGLYEIRDVAGPSPSVRHVLTLADKGPQQGCALPVTFNRFWVNTVPARNGLVAFDLSDMENVEEVGYVNLGENVRPHWISLEPDHERIVVSGDAALLNGVMMVEAEPDTGTLSIDSDFGDGGTVNFARENWPHGSTGPAVPHGAVFSIR